MSDGVRRVRVTRVGRGSKIGSQDAVAIEEPLEIRLHGRPFAVIMRTPGADRDLAAGFLLSEGVVSAPADIGAVEHCKHPDFPERHNIVDVFLLRDARAALERRLEARRHVVASSSCGVCGRVTIGSLRQSLPIVASDAVFDSTIAASLPVRLRSQQRLFDETGGLHGAALFAPDGSPLAFAEDVGRHNAVDKVVGRMLMDERLPLADVALAVSGRTSFEILQKAWTAGVALVCAVSAPSSLAVDVAAAAGITLLGFTRDGGFNIYAHPRRIRGVKGVTYGS